MKQSPSTLRQRTDMLEQSSWAREFTIDQIEKVSRYLYLVDLEKGDQIFEEGSRDAYMCIVVEGLVNVVKKDSEEYQGVIAEVGPGKTIGEMSLIDGWPRSAAAKTVEHTKVLVLSKENFEKLLDEYPRLGNMIVLKVAGLMSHRLRMTSWMLVECLAGEQRKLRAAG